MATTGLKTLDVSPEQRQADFDRSWTTGGAAFVGTYVDTALDLAANTVAADYVRGRIHDIVTDQAVADLLSPTNHPIGTKRICVDTDYYATYNRDNVELVSIADAPIQEITRAGCGWAAASTRSTPSCSPPATTR
jgi:cyclohexanone monooxygenase